MKYYQTRGCTKKWMSSDRCKQNVEEGRVKGKKLHGKDDREKVERKTEEKFCSWDVEHHETVEELWKACSKVEVWAPFWEVCGVWRGNE